MHCAVTCYIGRPDTSYFTEQDLTYTQLPGAVDELQLIFFFQVCPSWKQLQDGSCKLRLWVFHHCPVSYQAHCACLINPLTPFGAPT